MNQLYLLGGPPRTAKSTIMARVVKEQGIPLISTDAVQAGLRNVFINDPYQMLRGIEFAGAAEYKSSIETGGDTRQFSKKSDEANLTREIILGMLDHYARNEMSVAIEGSLVTPEWATELDVVEFAVRAAFVGYKAPSHADSILAHARDNPKDWINQWLEIEHGDETRIRAWVAKQAVASKQLKIDADAAGYPFYDMSKRDFRAYVGEVTSYYCDQIKDNHTE